MVISNTFQNLKDAYNIYTRAGPPQPPNPNSDLTRAVLQQPPTLKLESSRQRPARDEWADESRSGNLFDYSMRSPLRSRSSVLLKRRDADLQKEKQRYRALESSHQKAQEDLKQLKSNNTRLRAELRSPEGPMLTVIENHMHSYAQRNGFRFQFNHERSVQQLLNQFLDNMTENPSLREEVKALSSDVHTMRIQLEAAGKAELDRQHSHHRAEKLQEQVYRLQQQLLDQVEKDSAVSDDKFAKDFRCLVALIKSLSRSIRIAKDTNLLEVFGVGGMLFDIDSKHWSTRARKKCLAEAWIWSVLIDMIFASPFAVCGPHGGAMTELWQRLFGADHSHGWPIPSTFCEKWRYTTMEHSMKAFDLSVPIGNNEQDADMISEEDVDSFFYDDKISCSDVRDRAINIISSTLAAVSSKGDFTQIPPLVDRAVALALEMSVQRSRLQITYPSVRATFVETQMSAIEDPDGELLHDGVVAFIVRPGLTKWGDASGKHLDQRYDIVPALVQLEAREELTCIKTESF